MEKIYFGTCDYEGEPAIMLAVAKTWDETNGSREGMLPDEVYSIMCSMHVEYIEETLWGYFDGTEEELSDMAIRAGFIPNAQVAEEAASILE